MKASTILSELGIAHLTETCAIAVHSPIDRELIGRAASHSVADVDAALAKAQAAYQVWRNVPAPRPGELVRMLGNKLNLDQVVSSQVVIVGGGVIGSSIADFLRSSAITRKSRTACLRTAIGATGFNRVRQRGAE